MLEEIQIINFLERRLFLTADEKKFIALNVASAYARGQCDAIKDSLRIAKECVA